MSRATAIPSEVSPYTLICSVFCVLFGMNRWQRAGKPIQEKTFKNKQDNPTWDDLDQEGRQHVTSGGVTEPM